MKQALDNLADEVNTWKRRCEVLESTIVGHQSHIAALQQTIEAERKITDSYKRQVEAQRLLHKADLDRLCREITELKESHKNSNECWERNQDYWFDETRKAESERDAAKERVTELENIRVDLERANKSFGEAYTIANTRSNSFELVAAERLKAYEHWRKSLVAAELKIETLRLELKRQTEERDAWEMNEHSQWQARLSTESNLEIAKVLLDEAARWFDSPQHTVAHGAKLCCRRIRDYLKK